MSYDLGDYVDVKTRLQLALDRWPELRVIEEAPEIITMPDGKIYIQCAITVYRDADDLLPARAYLWDQYPGTTNFTRNREQPNAATSALGRALGYMGIGIHNGMASYEDVRNAKADNEMGEAKASARVRDTRSVDRPVIDPTTPVGKITYTNTVGQYANMVGPDPATHGQRALLATMSKERGLAYDTTKPITLDEFNALLAELKKVPKVKQ